MGGSGGGDAPTGAIDGLFSVSANSQVYFSRGNLQYRASTNTWRFAYSQNYCIGSANSNVSPTYSGWIDLFCWGTGNQPTNTLYNGDMFYDWGNNAISNGGNSTNMWRTLTIDEWDYVFNSRSTTMGVRYAKAAVEGMNGVILLPDNWNVSTYNLNHTNDGSAPYSGNVISDWSILEDAGAIFLPAAGGRVKYSTYYEINGVGSNGSYWSATRTKCVLFGDSYLSDIGSFSGISGISVRLVCDVEQLVLQAYCLRQEGWPPC